MKGGPMSRCRSLPITSWAPRTTDRSRGQGGAPHGRTTFTPARTVVEWMWVVVCLPSGGGGWHQSSIRVESHDGRAAWAAQSERAAVPKEAMTCGERAPTTIGVLIGHRVGPAPALVAE